MDTPQQKLELAKRYAPRFDQALRDRMAEVGIETFQDVADIANITVQTLGALRKGQNYPSDRTAWRLDGALRWRKRPSGTLALFNGGEPVPLADKPEKAEKFVDPIEQRIRSLPNLSEDVMNAILRKLHADRKAALEQAEAFDKLAQSEEPQSKRRRDSA